MENILTPITIILVVPLIKFNYITIRIWISKTALTNNAFSILKNPLLSISKGLFLLKRILDKLVNIIDFIGKKG